MIYAWRSRAQLLLLTAAGLVAGCQTSHERVARHEDHLAAAGFVIRPASTPERQAMLARLPAHKFVRETRGGHVHYVYADPTVCRCLYVGSQQAYGKFLEDRQDRVEDRQLKRELAANQHAAEDDDLEEQEYSDPAWNWEAWGPWGPEYGYGPGPGW